MPRKFYRKRKVYKKKNNLAKKVTQIQKKLKLFSPEVKHVDAYATTLAIDNNPTAGIFPYRAIAKGTGDYAERIGDDILAKYFQIKGSFILGAGAGADRFRVVAWIIKNNPDGINSAFSTNINLMLDSAHMNTVEAVNSFLEWDNNANYAKIYDKMYTINPSTATLPTAKPFSVYIRIPNRYRKVQYTAGTVYPTANELVVAFISQSDTGIVTNFVTRTAYQDP